MSDPSELQELAERKAFAASGRTELGAAGRAVAALLTDLYSAGLRHGITPQGWAAVAALPTACWDATVAAIRAQQVVRDYSLKSDADLSGTPRGQDQDQEPEPFLPAPPRQLQLRRIGWGRWPR